MTEWYGTTPLGKFSDIDADVLRVKRSGQECPPYTCFCPACLALLAFWTRRPTLVCVAVADAGILRWESCARARLPLPEDDSLEDDGLEKFWLGTGAC